jgi:hypothetical protein
MAVVRRAAAAVILCGIAAVSVPSIARAFERSTVDGDPSKNLFWRYRWVTIHPAYDTCEDVSEEGVRLAIARSVAAWNTAGETCSDFMLLDGGAMPARRTNLDGGDPDMINHIRWRQQGAWPDDPGTLALTTIVYRTASGQIVDADIDLNGDYDHFWTDTTMPGQVNVDVENTMTHELGHLLGLAHVLDDEATMYGVSFDGDLEKRTLAEDDVAGLCFIYPVGLSTPGAPVFDNPPLTSGCSAGRSARTPWLALVLILLGWRRARAARRGARRSAAAF